MSPTETRQGTLKFADGSMLNWEAEEFLPYEPSANHHDEGLIVSTDGSDDLYFISTMNGLVYAQADEPHDEIEGLTRLVEDAYSPEITDAIKRFDAMMNALEATRWVRVDDDA